MSLLGVRSYMRMTGDSLGLRFLRCSPSGCTGKADPTGCENMGLNMAWFQMSDIQTQDFNTDTVVSV